MQVMDPHVPDEELFSFADGELEPARAAAVGNHLSACWVCRTRREEMEVAITEFVRLHNQSLALKIPPPDGPRALLKVRFAKQLMHSRCMAGSTSCVSCCRAPG